MRSAQERYRHVRWGQCPHCNERHRYAVHGQPGQRLRNQHCYHCRAVLGRGANARAVATMRLFTTRRERMHTELARPDNWRPIKSELSRLPFGSR
jgi:RNase P subunit RPR2